MDKYEYQENTYSFNIIPTLKMDITLNQSVRIKISSLIRFLIVTIIILTTSTKAAFALFDCISEEDTLPPTFDCVENVYEDCAAGSCSKSIDNIGLSNLEDSCTVPAEMIVEYTLSGSTVGSGIDDASGTNFNVGVTNVTYVVTDTSGNSDSCSFYVVISDTTSPTLICPNEINATSETGKCDTLIEYNLSASDNCQSETHSFAVFQNFNFASREDMKDLGYQFLGSTLKNGKMVTSNLISSEARRFYTPFFKFNGNITVSFSDSTENINSGFNDSLHIYLVDSVGNETEIYNSKYETSNTRRFVDINYNVTGKRQLKFSYTTENNGAAKIYMDNLVIPGKFSSNILSPGITEAIEPLTPIKYDNLSVSSGDRYNIGDYVHKYKVYDYYGNIDTCVFEVHVVDNESPTFNCPIDTFICGANPAGVTVTDIEPININDNCSTLPNITLSHKIAGATTKALTSGNANGTLFNTGTSIVTYYITDENGNADSCSFDVVITTATAPSATISGDTNICGFDGEAKLKVELTGAAPWELTYQIDAANDSTINSIQTSTYFITATDEGVYTISSVKSPGCGGNGTGIGSATVSFIEPPSKKDISIITDPSPNTPPSGYLDLACKGETVVYEVNNTPGSYFLWSISGLSIDHDSTNSISVDWNVPPGDYTISVAEVNADGCSGPVSDTLVKVQDIPSATITGGDTTICNLAAKPEIQIELAGNSPWELTYQINAANDTTIESIQSSPYFIETTLAGTYSISSVRSMGCEGTTSGSAIVSLSASPSKKDINVTTDPSPNTPPLGYLDVACNGETAVYSVDNTPGSIFLWNVSGLSLDHDSTNSISVDWNMSSDDYTISVTEISADGCQGPDSDTLVKLQDIPSATITSSDTAFCDYASNPSIEIEFEGSAPWKITYQVDSGLEKEVNNINTTPYYLDAIEEGTYTISSVSSLGCIGNASGNVTVGYLDSPGEIEIKVDSNTSPIPNNEYFDIVCIFDKASYSVVTPKDLDYIWNIGGFDIDHDSSGTLEVNWNVVKGQYTLSVYAIDSNGCFGPSTDTSILVTRPTLNFVEDVNICPGDSVIYKAPTQNINSYLWHDGSEDSNYVAKEEREIILQITDVYGCTNSDTSYVSHYPEPVVNLGNDTIICDVYELSPNGVFDNYEWSTGDSSRTITVRPGDQTIILEVFNMYGCSDKDTINFSDCIPEDFVIANVFTPNNDGVHDAWTIKGIEFYPHAKIEVFDRWGKRVFLDDDGYHNDWEGTYKGRDLPATNYFYIIDLKGDGNKIFKGSLTILK